MKVSLSWVKEFTDVNMGVDELVKKIGAQLGAVEEVVDLEPKYKGAVLVKVVSCRPHPNADKLKVCLVDDRGQVKNVPRNDQGLVEVVCGAPNVAEGLQVVWLPPGSTVPSSYSKDPFVLDAKEIRGVKSNGMLASPRELAISDNHDGLLIVDKGAPGDSFADTYKLNDHIIDIENKMFTHRPDLFGIIGVAREIAGITNKKFTSKPWYLTPRSDAFKIASSARLPLVVENHTSELVPRFMAIALSDVEIKPSPIQVQSYLTRVGIRPINNVVDVTNFIMYLTAQPLHAYDYDKVRALDPGADHATIMARLPKKDEKIMLLNGKEVTPAEKTVLIATDTKAIGIGGVMGGAETEVDANTKNIILECATFDMYNIRRTSMALGLFTDAVTRYTKGQSPLQNDRVLAETVAKLGELAGAKVADELRDISPAVSLSPELKVEVAFVNSRLGLNLSSQEMSNLLKNVEFGVSLSASSKGKEELIVGIPFWRTDIEIPEDIVEEVGRLYGYEHLPLVLPRRSISAAAKNPELELKKQIRDTLSGAGANEVLTYSFVNEKLMTKVGQDREKALKISNALSPDLQFYRLSLTPNLLEQVHPNLRAGWIRNNDDNEFVIYELNKTHNKVQVDEDSLPLEFDSLALIFSADKKTSDRKYFGAAYFQAKEYLNLLLDKLNVQPDSLKLDGRNDEDYSDNIWLSELVKPYEPNRSSVLKDKQGKVFGILGEFRSSVKKSLKLPDFTAGLELDLRALQQYGEKESYVSLPKFPKVQQDISLKTPSAISYQTLYEYLTQELQNKLPPNTTFTIKPLDIYQKEEEPELRQISFRIWVVAYDHTLESKDVNELLDKVAETAKDKLGVERISSANQNTPSQ